ncbi:MAG: inorganic pyrophosphatase [Bacteriovoracaceae bacterium]|jgi:inorganic pyrophosphatase
MSKNLKKTKGLLISLCFLISCTQIGKHKESSNQDFGSNSLEDAIVSRIVPRWFSGHKEFTLRHSSGQGVPHMFYDVSPDIDINKFTLNFVVTTPEGSPFSYNIDLASGQHVVNKAYCVQNDIWKQFSEGIFTPPFTMGIVPKILDQIGDPQKIIVFGDQKNYENNFTSNYFDARIVGGFIEQVCPIGGCFKDKEWKSRIVLIGVQKDHEKFHKVETITELKKVVNWPLVEAFIENGQGINRVVTNTYPAFRFGALITKEQALRYLDKNSVYLKNNKLLGMRKSCHRLYNHIWNKVYKDSPYETQMKSLKTARERLSFIKSEKSLNKSLFYKRFKKAFIDYNTEYKTCLHFIYPSSINDNIERHWFFSYYSAVHLLHELEYSFDCNRGIWIKNVIGSNGKRIISLGNEFKKCNARMIDSAFELGIPFMDSLRKKNYQSYRYVDYDSRSFGTHKKVYSWVLDDNKVFSCDEEPEFNVQMGMKTFPKDVSWKRKRLKFNSKGQSIK